MDGNTATANIASEYDRAEARRKADGTSAMNRVKTFFQQFHKRSPRGWAISVFPVFCLLTVVGLPIDVMIQIAMELPRIIRNLYSDVKGVITHALWSEARMHKVAWRIWWDSIKGSRHD